MISLQPQLPQKKSFAQRCSEDQGKVRGRFREVHDTTRERDLGLEPGAPAHSHPSPPLRDPSPPRPRPAATRPPKVGDGGGAKGRGRRSRADAGPRGGAGAGWGGARGGWGSWRGGARASAPLPEREILLSGGSSGAGKWGSEVSRKSIRGRRLCPPRRRSSRRWRRC